MARRDTRSPSPTGSSYSANRRYRRDDERKAHRHHRSRSRSHERPSRDYRDHRGAERRQDRTIDYRDDSRRQRSRDRDRNRDRDRERERRRSRSRSPRHDARNGRDYRIRKEHSRERRRRDHSADYKHKVKREPSRDRPAGHVEELAQVKKITDDEKKKTDRMARLQAWKEKQAQVQAQAKLKDSSVPAGVQILLDMDKKANSSPLAFDSPGSPGSLSGANSPTPYAGKFDPKAVMKKASSSHSAQPTLGIDVYLPSNGPVSATPNDLPDNERPRASRPLKATGNMSGFGLANKPFADQEKKKKLDFGEEESSRKKLEKLPTPPVEDSESTHQSLAISEQHVVQAEEENDDDDVNMDDAGSEEEALAAARAAAEKRLASDLDPEKRISEDVEMHNAPDISNQVANFSDHIDTAEEYVDPLDAFMADLSNPSASHQSFRKPKTLSKKVQQEPQAMFGDDDADAAEDLDIQTDKPDDFLAITSRKKKRDIPSVDHAKVNYDSFRKDFYTEPIEMASMTEAEVSNLRFELDGIKVRGVDVPKPVLKWAQCGLGVPVLDVIRSLAYDKPSSIQSQAIPAIMSGRDVIGVAKTGSGKTIAFLLPMFRHIKDQRPLDSMDGPLGLVMTPTRELATQIHKECKPFLKALNLRAVCAYGGAPIKDQIADLKRGAEIIVCTPGRMIELLSANSGRVTNLRRVTYVVLDEADRMFDMGFEPQVMKILGNVRPQRQTVLFSATFPRNMEALARKVLAMPIEITVGGRSVVAPEITQIIEVRAENTKFFRLLELLGSLYDKDEDARSLIFVDRQESADGLLRELMRKGYPCNSIHGGKDQIDRDSTIDDFKAGVIPILIATSVAARGLDVKQLKLVVNYDVPNHLEDYVHRAGRTGRAGNTGTAVTFITEDQDRYSIDLVKALRQSGTTVPEHLQKLADSFMEKVKAGKAKANASGFGGKGLDKLDQDRDAARKRERSAYRTGDEPEEEEQEETKEEEFIVTASTSVAMTGMEGFTLDENSIVVHKTETPKSGPDSKNPLDKVRAAVANIGDRLNKRGQMHLGHPIDNKGPDAGAFHASLEINDFPQKARWAVTNRTNVAKILEATGTSITTKGNFYDTKKGQKPGPNDAPKLYILVEGDTEVVVQNAMRELYRLLKEGTVAAETSEARAPASGRYNVV